MGIIRKTASISTLGLIKFRSKKERLRRAEAAHRSASDDLAAEQAARGAAEQRVAEAERRARHAELEALHEAKVSRRRARKLKAHKGRKTQGVKAGRGRRARRKAAKRARQAESWCASSVSGLGESVSGLVSAAQPVLEAGARGPVVTAGPPGGAPSRRRPRWRPSSRTRRPRPARRPPTSPSGPGSSVDA